MVKEDREESYWQEGMDMKKLFLCLLSKLPYIIVTGVTGALLGSGLYLLIAMIENRVPQYQAETEYYIEFAEGRLEAKDYYNDYTWNDVLATDLILGNTMELLGAGYAKDEVKNMITADILSDVRYLTITVSGEDEERVNAVSQATRQSLEAFGSRMAEFSSIYQIEEHTAAAFRKPLFTWRALVFGAICGLAAGVMWFAVWYGLSGAVYTKVEFEKRYGIPMLGILYRRQREAFGRTAQGKKADSHSQETELLLQLSYHTREITSVIFADVSEQKLAEVCKEQIAALYKNLYKNTEKSKKSEQKNLCIYEVQPYPIHTQEEYEALRAAGGVLLVIPFGKECREKTTDVIDSLRKQNCKIIGAILADADKKWIQSYYGGSK